MAYSAVLSATLNGAPTLGNIRVSVDGQTVSSGITAIANTNGAGFQVTVSTLTDGFRGPFTFYDSTDSENFATGSVGPEDELLDAAVSSRSVFDHTADTVTTDAPSRTASQADVSSLATAAAVGNIPTNPLLTNDARLDNLDATVSSRSVFDHTADTVTTDAPSRTASQADVSSLATAAAVGNIPTNPLLTNDARLDNLDATVSSRSVFDHTADTVTTDAPSRTASQADVSSLATQVSVDALPSATDIAAAVWAATTRTLTSAALSVADIWTYATRTLTGTVVANVVQVDGNVVSGVDDFKADVSNVSVDEAAVASAVADRLAADNIDVTIESALSSTGQLTITKNETLEVSWSGLSIPADVQDIYFTVQTNIRDGDDEAVVQVKTSSGLMRLNGEAAATSADGELTYDQPGGTAALTLEAGAIELIEARSVLHYDLKYVTSAGIRKRLAQGRVIVGHTPTKA